MGWFKMLEDLDSPRISKRLEQRVYEMLVASADFTKERADEFKDQLELFSMILMIHADWVREKGPFEDLFGTYLTETEQLNARAGQFFTPMQVVDAMVKITISKETMMGKPQKILDPAAGCGCFMLGTAKHYAQEVGFFNFVSVNVDIDFRMYVYCTLNAILNKIPAIVIWGDSLGMDYREGFIVVNGAWEHIDADTAKRVFS